MNFSFSNINNYLKCPKRFKFELTKNNFQDTQALFLGRTVHSFIDRFLKGETITHIPEILTPFNIGKQLKKILNANLFRELSIFKKIDNLQTEKKFSCIINEFDSYSKIIIQNNKLILYKNINLNNKEEFRIWNFKIQGNFIYEIQSKYKKGSLRYNKKDLIIYFKNGYNIHGNIIKLNNNMNEIIFKQIDLLNGRIDCFFINSKNELIVIDFKTSRKNSESKYIVDWLQMFIYIFLILNNEEYKNINFSSIMGLFWFVRDNTKIHKIFTKEEVFEKIKKLKNIISEINKKEILYQMGNTEIYKPNLNIYCKFCSLLKNSCKKWENKIWK